MTTLSCASPDRRRVLEELAFHHDILNRGNQVIEVGGDFHAGDLRNEAQAGVIDPGLDAVHVGPERERAGNLLGTAGELEDLSRGRSDSVRVFVGVPGRPLECPDIRVRGDQPVLFGFVDRIEMAEQRGRPEAEHRAGIGGLPLFRVGIEGDSLECPDIRVRGDQPVLFHPVHSVKMAEQCGRPEPKDRLETRDFLAGIDLIGDPLERPDIRVRGDQPVLFGLVDRVEMPEQRGRPEPKHGHKTLGFVGVDLRGHRGLIRSDRRRRSPQRHAANEQTR